MLQTVYITIGLPASGKTTWAREMLAKDRNLKRINKDDLRAMADSGVYSPDNEAFILRIRNLFIQEALDNGYSVIVDDCNFNPFHISEIECIVNKLNADYPLHPVNIEKVKFDTSLEECILRDSLRDASVGEKVIVDMHLKYIEN